MPIPFLTKRQPLGMATMALLLVVLIHALRSDFSVLVALSVAGLAVYLPNAFSVSLHWVVRGIALLGQAVALCAALMLALTITFMADGGRNGWQAMDLMDWLSTWGVVLLGGASSAASVMEWIAAKKKDG